MFSIEERPSDDRLVRAGGLEVRPDRPEILKCKFIAVGVIAFRGGVDLPQPVEVKERVSDPSFVELFRDCFRQRRLPRSDRSCECDRTNG